jgi:hypothetical protein
MDSFTRKNLIQLRLTTKGNLPRTFKEVDRPAFG